MPNGGYPMHFLAPLPDTDLGIHAKATSVRFVQRSTAGQPPSWTGVGSLTSEQVGALTYHLLYWSTGMNSAALAALRDRLQGVKPALQSRDFLYDY